MQIDDMAGVARSEAVKEWFRLRVENIHRHVSAADVLSRHGVRLHKDGTHSEQISCPFHGADKRPSAKYYPEDGDKPSGVWCFVCRERWDTIALWKKFTGTEKFGDVLREIERGFGLTVPESSMIPRYEKPVDPLKEKVEHMLEVCETRLREHRDRFELLSHLRLGSLVDHTRFHAQHGTIPLEEAIRRLTLVLARIAEKARAKTPSTP